MSTPDGNELRGLIFNVLESQGVLGKLRAQMRVSVLQATENIQREEGEFLRNAKKANKISDTEEGRLILSLICDFCRAYNLDSTMSSLLMECSEEASENIPEPRSSMVSKLGMGKEISKKEASQSLLEILVLRALKKSKNSTTDQSKNSIGSTSGKFQEKGAADPVAFEESYDSFEETGNMGSSLEVSGLLGMSVDLGRDDKLKKESEMSSSTLRGKSKSSNSPTGNRRRGASSLTRLNNASTDSLGDSFDAESAIESVDGAQSIEFDVVTDTVEGKLNFISK
eukprot:g4815.t1